MTWDTHIFVVLMPIGPSVLTFLLVVGVVVLSFLMLRSWLRRNS